ncbi:MAG: hypothetical protein AMXMBFR34_11750 [Myxococcaceae bacterium]
MTRRLFLSALALLATGCSSVQPALRDRTNALLGDYRSRAPGLVPAPATAGPRAWEPGQYVVYAVTREGKPGLLRYAVEERTAEGVWLGIQELSYETKSLWRVLLKRDLTSAEDAVSQARRAIVQPDGQATRIYDFEADSSPVVAKMRESMAPLWAGFLPAQSSGSPSAVNVTAGRFEGATEAKAALHVLGVVSEFRGHRHDAVPLTGLLDGKTSDGKATIELLEYGDDAASPLF